jgi:hypothetical protein
VLPCAVALPSQPFEEPPEFLRFDVAEPRAFLLEVFKFLKINGLFPEVVEVVRDKSELLALLKLP